VRMNSIINIPGLKGVNIEKSEEVGDRTSRFASKAVSQMS